MSQKAKRGLCFAMAGLMLGSVVTGCKTKVEDYSTTVVATYGEENIYMDEAYFYAKLTQYQYESYYGNSLWAYDFSGKGETFEDSVKENVMSQIYQTYILNDEAEKMNIKLNEEEIALVEKNIKEFLEDEKLVEVTKATEAMVEKVYTMNAIANLVYEKLIENTDREVDEKEFICKNISYISLTSLSDDITDEELEAVADEVLEEMKEGTKLEDIKKAYESDDYKLSVTDKYTLKKDATNAYQEEAWKLAKGEFTKTFSSKTAHWYIIQCNEDDDKDAQANAIKNEIASREAEEFKKQYESILENAKELKVNETKWGEIVFIGETVYVPESTEKKSEGASESVEESTEETSEAK